MRAELTTALACLLICLALTVGKVLYFTKESYYVVLRPTLIERTWHCDPANGRSSICDGHEANRSFFRGVGYRGQSCADAYWLRKYAKDIAYPDGSTTKMTLMFSAYSLPWVPPVPPPAPVPGRPSPPWDQRAYEEALERGGELSKYMRQFDDLCADRGFCAAQGYAPEDSLGRHFRKDKDIEAPNRFQYLAPRGRCWDVLEARGNHWRGMDPALWREWDPALWRDLSTWWRCCCKVHMITKRDSDVPTVCQASPRGVATKAIVEADLRFNRAQGGNKCEGSRLMINDC